MKDMIFRLVLEWAASYLTTEKVDELEEALMNKLLPYLKMVKDELMDRLHEVAKKTETNLDDAAVNAVDSFLINLLERLED